MVMVVLQMLAYGTVCDNREVRKEKKRLERSVASEEQEVHVESVLVGEKMEREGNASWPSTPLVAGSLTSTEARGSDSDFTELTDTSEEETII